MPDLAKALHNGEFTVKVQGEEITEDVVDDKHAAGEEIDRLTTAKSP